MRDKVLVVIPVYNHGTTLHSVVKLVLEHHPHLLVVDDGSTDGGTQSLDSLSCTVVVHEKNTGKGAAILTAAQYAESLGMTHIITIDADGQHSPEDLAVFFAALPPPPPISAGLVGSDMCIRDSPRYDQATNGLTI
jgi:glycosyltransferase involved in cell wall biosynthesis